MTGAGKFIDGLGSLAAAVDQVRNLPTARDHTTLAEVATLLQSAKSGAALDSGAGVESGAAIELTAAARITKAGLLDDVVTTARALKAAELEHRACQERYAAAVRALSEEAVK